MIRAFDAFSLPLLRWFDPEDAHRLAIQGLKLVPPVRPRLDDAKLAVRAFGLNFPNPIGMAAGFDKSAEVPDALLRLGFGFVEIGTVTPKPQVGNPRPRLFRLDRDQAVINRMGFNNDGAEAVLRRLAARARHGGIIGVNVGANKDAADRVADYVRLIEIFAPVASYFTINVSSPNTPGLRNLQQAAALDDLLARVIDARERVRQNAGDSPVLLKIAPDLSLAELAESSKSYIWELENKNPPRPSADKVAKIAAVLGVTADYLIDTTEKVGVEDATDNAFFRKYRKMDAATKDKIRRMADLLGDDE